jgi:hypothetical protein
MIFLKIIVNCINPIVQVKLFQKEFFPMKLSHFPSLWRMWQAQNIHKVFTEIRHFAAPQIQPDERHSFISPPLPLEKIPVNPHRRNAAWIIRLGATLTRSLTG